ncbi:uncharacterized protein LOC117569841 [Drosophila albomicans]|uniref:Uncharacterized protein LOC117569841 n=1 Tax=Drosophila albomicans TaxID=7291 RepID=A0A6P8WTP0_DROAB|nr:uncharacterized protein LOC117569841 [Drosophila albomicans]
MAKESWTIKSWAIVIAVISALYSLIYMGIEISNVMNRIIGPGMLATWTGVYFANILMNAFFMGRKGDWGKSEVVLWIIVTLVVYILRLVLIDYRKISERQLIFAIAVNVYIPLTFVMKALLYYQVANPTTDISTCLFGGGTTNVKSKNTGEVIVEDLSHTLHSTTAPNINNLNNDIEVVCDANDRPPSYKNVLAGQNTNLLSSKD